VQLLSLRVSSSSLWQESGLDSDVVFSESGARQLRHSTSPSRVVECEPGDMGNERGAHLKASCFEDLLHNVSIEAAVLDNRPVREFNSGHTYLTGRPRNVAGGREKPGTRIAPSQNLWGCSTRLSKQELSLGPIRMPRAGQREPGMSDAVL